MNQHEKIRALIQKGVRVPAPATIEIDNAVNIDHISGDGVILHAGTKIFGGDTVILSNSVVGKEGPVTLQDCYVGMDVMLRSGFFKQSIFLEGANLGSGSHVREGTILEEQASTAHCVGMKQTILFPFVTLGSLINFCDCLLSGGTSRKNHSEVGSSFVHFNFTPNQDKATPSLLGDVPSGVMLNQKPIFMGGQGGLVGPCRIAYGSVSAAGTIVRKDQLKPDHLILGGTGKGGSIPWKAGGIGLSKRVLENNLIFIGNLLALREWYRHVRRLFISNRFPEIMLQGLIATLDMGLDERLKRLAAFIEDTGSQIQTSRYSSFEKRCQDRRHDRGNIELRDHFLQQMTTITPNRESYLDAIQILPEKTVLAGTQWLQSIVNDIVAEETGTVIS